MIRKKMLSLPSLSSLSPFFMMNIEEENELQPLRIIGTPKRRNGKYVLDEYAILGRECGWICPRCNNEVRITPTRAGEQSFMCNSCYATFEVRVDAEANTFMLDKRKAVAPKSFTPSLGEARATSSGKALDVAFHQSPPARGILLVPDETTEKPEMEKVAEQDTSGMLVWGGLFSRKRYHLRAGSNVIGRKDNKATSDVEFDDPEMSRRSVKIDAIPDGEGNFTFMLTVLKSLNPVTVNDQTITPEEVVRLNNGDTITLGKTTLTFKT